MENTKENRFRTQKSAINYAPFGYAPSIVHLQTYWGGLRHTGLGSLVLGTEDGREHTVVGGTAVTKFKDGSLLTQLLEKKSGFLLGGSSSLGDLGELVRFHKALGFRDTKFWNVACVS